MFPIRKRILLLHLGGSVIRTTADHLFDVQGRGWTEAADLRPGDSLRSHTSPPVPIDGISDSGEQAVVYRLNVGEHPMADQSRPNQLPPPIIGFAAGTPLRTPEGHKPIEELGPGDFIQSGPPDDQRQDEGDPEHDEAELPDSGDWD